ncbi:hypothetical protein PVNG_05548 [Plasmodium vivax North Korean]|uniref:Uncharacterized protein n=1 Tax=Plasmodium vivax North Korean TaxID=1035514 RepID=A0A0J9U0S7_PLAVI|nr:hypothetical protein PVNG_05548 [Plasmodium vivax North Korean]
MFPIKKDDFFEKLQNNYTFIKNFSLGKIYTLFVLKDVLEDRYEGICNDLKKGSKYSCDFRFICASLVNELIQFKDKFDENKIKSFTEECKYLNYWIHYILKNSSECNNFNLLYKQLNEVKLHYIPKGHSCDLEYFEITKENFHRKKELFFHAEILNWLKSKDIHIKPTEKDSYNQYLDHVFNIYKEIICNDDSNLKATCSNELRDFKTNFNDAISNLEAKSIIISQALKNLEKKSICQNQPSKHPGGELHAKRDQVAVKQVEESGSEGQEPGTDGLGLTKQFQAKESGPDPVKMKEREGQEQLVGAQLPRILGPRGPDDQASRGPMIEENNEDPPTPDITNKAGTVGATLAGSSLFLLMMYKVIKHIFNKYYHFMIICLLYYHSMLLVKKQLCSKVITFFLSLVYSFGLMGKHKNIRKK